MSKQATLKALLNDPSSFSLIRLQPIDDFSPSLYSKKLGRRSRFLVDSFNPIQQYFQLLKREGVGFSYSTNSLNNFQTLPKPDNSLTKIAVF